jgi:hypothetical protein
MQYELVDEPVLIVDNPIFMNAEALLERFFAYLVMNILPLKDS